MIALCVASNSNSLGVSLKCISVWYVNVMNKTKLAQIDAAGNIIASQLTPLYLLCNAADSRKAPSIVSNSKYHLYSEFT